MARPAPPRSRAPTSTRSPRAIASKYAVAEGDRAAVRWRARGTFDGTGKLEGIAPTGAELDIEGCDVLTVRDGKVVANHAYTNGMEMARQMGVMPPAKSLGERAMLGAANARTVARDRLRRLLDR